MDSAAKKIRVARPHSSGWAEVTIDGVRCVLCIDQEDEVSRTIIATDASGRLTVHMGRR